MQLVDEFLTRVEERRTSTAAALDSRERAKLGQFFTPRDSGALLAGMVPVLDAPWRLLDPGAGVGSLAAALIARWLRSTEQTAMQVLAYEIDPNLIPPLKATLEEARIVAEQLGRTLDAEVREANFILDPPRSGECTVVVMNPPYGKLNTTSAERAALENMEDPVRVTNLYAAFLVRAIRALSAGGQLVAITPRSFANGPYFRALRAALLDRASFERVHVFETRDQVFADADVLQENVVFSMRSGASPTTVVVSSSEDALGEIKSWECSHSQIVRPDDEARFVRLPLNEDAIRIAEQMLAMPATLANLGIRASTGRVVDFRSRSHLLNAPEPGAVPLVYPHNVRAGCIVWPLPGRKSQALAISEATERLLLPNEYYVIVKRFSAKEEPRRVVAALSVPEAYDGATQIGFENHLNVFHKAGRGLDRDLAVGLAHYLNSDLVDDYIRQFNGHTQINATDLHELRYPSLEQLRALGGSVVTPSIPVEEAADQLPFTSAPTTESSRAAA